MKRFLISLVVGAALGVGLGLMLGWQVFPVEYTNGPSTALRQDYQNEYTLMVAEGYLLDGNANGAFDRLRMLQVDNIPLHVQTVTESYITNSRSLEEIRALVALSEALGRLTPIMEPYRPATLPGQNQ